MQLQFFQKPFLEKFLKGHILYPGLLRSYLPNSAQNLLNMLNQEGTTSTMAKVGGGKIVYLHIFVQEGI